MTIDQPSHHPTAAQRTGGVHLVFSERVSQSAVDLPMSVEEMAAGEIVAARDWEADVRPRYPTVSEQLRHWLSCHVRGEPVPIYFEMREGDDIRAFVRKSCELVTIEGKGVWMDCLSIAGVYLPEEMRGRGWLKSFLTLCVELNPWPRLVMESVVVDELAAFCERMGFATVDPDFPGTFLVDAAAVRRLNVPPL